MPHGGGHDIREMRAPVWGRETPALAQVAPAPLERVAAFGKTLDPGICRHDRRDLVADLGRAPKTEDRRSLGTGPPADLREDFPLGARLARAWPRDFGTEDDAA